MTLTDPIGQMLTVIRNGLTSDKKEVRVFSSKVKKDICAMLKKEGFIEDYKEAKEENKNFLIVILKYNESLPAIRSIRRISKPGRRIYVDKLNIPIIKGGRGRVILSTSSGVITDKDAKEKGVGGEAILEVW